MSTNGGIFARWRPDGQEIFYLSPSGRLMAAEVRSTSARFEYGARKKLFDSQEVAPGHASPYHPYAVSREGQRFLIPRIPRAAGTVSDTSKTFVTVVLNWPALLKK